MSVFDGQNVSAAVTNPAFLKPDVDDFTVSRLGMERASSPSGFFVQDIQRYINNVAQVIGLVYTGNYTAEADSTGNTYGSTSSIISNGLVFKTAITNLANAFASTTGAGGHSHTGSGADGVKIPLTTSVSGTLPIANGGTNGTTSTTAFNNLSPMTTSGDLISGGASGSGQRLGIGSTGQLLTVVSGAPAWANPGTWTIAEGGTGATTASGAFNNLSPMTTLGDVITGGAAGAGQRLGVGSTGQILTVVSGAPAWANPATSGVLSQGTLTVSGSFVTPSTSTTSTIYYYRMCGGGGGGGGANGAGAAGGGGGAGAYAEGTFTGLAASTSVTVTVGAAGSAGTTAGGNGGNGGATSIAASGLTTITCGGGIGGNGSTSAAGGAFGGGAGGTVTSGSPPVNIQGGHGITGAGFAALLGGTGGTTPFGGAGTGGVTTGGGSAGPAAPTAPGAGGSGGTSTATAGTVGVQGVVIILQITP